MVVNVLFEKALDFVLCVYAYCDIHTYILAKTIEYLWQYQREIFSISTHSVPMF